MTNMVVGKDPNFQAIFQALNPTVCRQLTDLRLSGLPMDSQAQKSIYTHLRCCSKSNQLPLRRASLALVKTAPGVGNTCFVKNVL